MLKLTKISCINTRNAFIFIFYGLEYISFSKIMELYLLFVLPLLYLMPFFQPQIVRLFL